MLTLAGNGRLTRKPELRTTSSGATVTTVAIAMWVAPACSTIRAAGRSSQPQSVGHASHVAAEAHARASRVVAVDNEQYVDWVAARFGVQLAPAAGFHAIAQLTGSQVEYRRMDGFAVRDLKERFDVVLCFGILHRVTDPIAFLQTLADVLAPGGEIVLETYGSTLAADTPAIELREPGDVYARDDFTYTRRGRTAPRRADRRAHRSAAMRPAPVAVRSSLP